MVKKFDTVYRRLVLFAFLESKFLLLAFFPKSPIEIHTIATAFSKAPFACNSSATLSASLP